MILAAADEYMEALQDNPLIEHDFVGKDAIEVDRRKMRAPSWERFSLFCGVHKGYFDDMRADLKKLKEPTDQEKGISAALMCIENLFYAEKFEGAAAGLLNPGLIGKSLGIVERVDHTTNGDSIKSVPVVLSNGKSLDDLMNELNPE